MESDTSVFVLCFFLSCFFVIVAAAVFLFCQKKNNLKELSVRKLNSKQLPTYLNQLSKSRPNQLNADTAVKVLAFFLIAVPTIAVNAEHQTAVLVIAVTLIFVAPIILPLIWRSIQKLLKQKRKEKNLDLPIHMATCSDRNHAQPAEGPSKLII